MWHLLMISHNIEGLPIACIIFNNPMDFNKFIFNSNFKHCPLLLGIALGNGVYHTVQSQTDFSSRRS